MKLLPLGGLGEIGMNCLVLEHENEILVVDCGLLFSDLDHFGVEFVIPDFNYLIENKDKVKGFLITHGHEDHIGALAFALKAGVEAPIYASHFTSLLIREKFKEYGLSTTAQINTFRMGEVLKFKHFKVETVSVNHSIIDSAALIIDTPVGKIVHTGDFKIDPTPFMGSTIDLNKFAKAGDEGVLLLLSDSTNVERHDHSLSEKIIYKKFESVFTEAKGLTVVSMFASNIARIGQVFELAKKLDKRIVLSGRTMEQNVRLAAEAGHIKGPESLLVGLDDLDSYVRKDVIVLATGSQGEHRSSLIRIAHGEHSQIQLQKGDLVVMSSKFIPGNEIAIGRMINNLFKQGAEVLYESVHDIHVSGHATRPELKKMLEMTKPKFFIPIHGEYRHLVHHGNLAKEAGVKPQNVIVAVNGDVIELDKESCKIVEHIEETRVLIEGREGNDISKLILKERRQMGEKGVVFSLVVRNSGNRRIISGPEILSKGLVADEVKSAELNEKAKKIVARTLLDYDQQLATGHVHMDLQETVRIELRRFFNQQLGKKPVVLPIILDL